MTGISAFKPRSATAPIALLALAALLLGGCLASRAPVPTQAQRTPEAEGRKARMEREAAEAPSQAQAATPAPAAQAPTGAKPAEPAPTKDAAGAKAEALPAEPAKVEAKAVPAAPEPQAQAEAKAEPGPALSAEKLPAKELTLQGPGQYVQIASFGTEKYADGAVAWLSANGYAAARVVRVEQGGSVLHRVQAGPFQDPAAARGALDALKAHWPQAFIPAD